MFKILSEELISKIIGYGHIHYGPYSLWISCGNPVKKDVLNPLGKHKNTFDIKKLYILSQVNKELSNKCLPILLNIKNWYLMNRKDSDQLIRPLRDMVSVRALSVKRRDAHGRTYAQDKIKIVRHLVSMYDKTITSGSFMEAFCK